MVGRSLLIGSAAQCGAVRPPRSFTSAALCGSLTGSAALWPHAGSWSMHAAVRGPTQAPYAAALGLASAGPGSKPRIGNGAGLARSQEARDDG